MEKNVRVRFAPSPTGPLHIGGVRTALYNYLFARKNNGKFILRIEDTDQTRFVEGAEAYIINSLNWAGITFDEGVHLGGPYAPYKQSERFSVYEKYAKILLDNNAAYYAFDTQEELEQLRIQYQNNKQNFQYDATNRLKLKNSLTLSKDSVETLIKERAPYVLRFLMPENRTIVFNDLIRGEVHFNTSLLDDKVLFKSDGLPTYHLANVVDDHLMQISHVIRGEEWLPSAPLHVLLYEALGWKESMPLFAHLPLLLKPDGNGKLSKRDGDRLGFPVFPMQWKDPKTNEIYNGFKESGYFPEAFINMLALLGWNPGNEKEIFTMNELVEAFSLDKISKSGAKFSPDKAKWFNQFYLHHKSSEMVAVEFKDILKQHAIVASDSLILNVVNLVKDRVCFVNEIWQEASFFFVAPETYDTATISKKCDADSSRLLEILREHLIDVNENWTSLNMNESIHAFMEVNNLKPAHIMPLLRIVLVGQLKGPDLFEIIHLLGKNETLKRIEKGRLFLNEFYKK